MCELCSAAWLTLRKMSESVPLWQFQEVTLADVGTTEDEGQKEAKDGRRCHCDSRSYRVADVHPCECSADKTRFITLTLILLLPTLLCDRTEQWLCQKRRR